MTTPGSRKAAVDHVAEALMHLEKAEAAAIDDLLWTFADRSFVPHAPAGSDPDVTVEIGCEAPRPARVQLLVIPGAANTIDLSWLKPFDTTADGPERRARRGTAKEGITWLDI